MARINPGASLAPPSSDRVGATDLRELSMDHFLQLMIAELQNQDPLNPLDNSEILQQIGQIREIGATNRLSDTLDAVLTGTNLSTASTMIGKQVQALSVDLQEIEGVVERVSVQTDPQNESVRNYRLHVVDSSGAPHMVDLRNVREVRS